MKSKLLLLKAKAPMVVMKSKLLLKAKAPTVVQINSSFFLRKVKTSSKMCLYKQHFNHRMALRNGLGSKC
jgi:hypothetical protein